MAADEHTEPPRTYQDGEWFFGEPILVMADGQGNEVHAVPIGLTSYGSMPLLILSPTGPAGNFYLYRNGTEVPDFRERFIEHLDKWLVSIGLPPGDHRLDIWAYWQFEGRPSGQREREALSAFYDRVAKHGPPSPSPKWSDGDGERLATEMTRTDRTVRERWSRSDPRGRHSGRSVLGGTILTLVDTHSGQASELAEGELSLDTMASLVPQLSEMLETGECAVPDQLGYTLSGTSERKCLVAAVRCRGAPAVTLFVAVSDKISRWLWDEMHKEDHRLATRRLSPPPAPWCALRIETPHLATAMTGWIGDYAILAAWSWLVRHRRISTDLKEDLPKH